jgi:hypothetical protein
MMKTFLMRILFVLVSLCIANAIFPLSYAMSSSFQVEYKASLISYTIGQVVAVNLPNQIFRRWTHSREEDQGETMVYRSDDYPFPPARGREGLEFRENGEFIQYRIGAADVNSAVSGRWSIQGETLIEVRISNQSASSYTLRIVECDDQILKVIKIN